MQTTKQIIAYSKPEYNNENHSHSHPSKNCENFLAPAHRGRRRSQHETKQLSLFPEPEIPRKAQISSIPGVSLKERNRYRVVIGDAILGDKLTLDEALKLAKKY